MGDVCVTPVTTVGGKFVPYSRNIILGPNGGTLDTSGTAGILFYGVNNSVGTIQGGTLIKDGVAELRVQGVPLRDSSFEKLVVRGGLYRAGFQSFQSENFLGATPVSLIPDQITISNGAMIGHSLNPFEISANRGIVLGAGGGRLRDTWSIPGVISGTKLIKDTSTGTIVLRGANTYTDGTLLTIGTIFARNTTGSATGSGSVLVTNAALGGDGIIGGPVTMTGGNLTPGYNYTVDYAALTRISNSIAQLTLTNGVDMSQGATNTWQLAALST